MTEAGGWRKVREVSPAAGGTSIGAASVVRLLRRKNNNVKNVFVLFFYFFPDVSLERGASGVSV